MVQQRESGINKSSMKVLWFSESPSLASRAVNVSGVGRGWIESLEEKLTQMDDIELAIGFLNGAERSGIRQFKIGNTKYYSIPNGKGKWKAHLDRHFTLFNDEKIINHSLEIVEDFKPDVIQVFGTEDVFGLIAGKTNIPVIVHIQGLLTVYTRKWYSSGISKWDLIKRTPLKQLLRANTLMHDFTYYKKRAKREKKVFSTVKNYIGRTDWDRRVCKVLSPGSRYFFGSEMLRKPFYEAKWGKAPQSSKILISTIQANIYKGLETVLETAAILKNTEGLQFKWLIAGIAEGDPIVTLFEKKLNIICKDNNIFLLGRLKAEELLMQELSADVFVHPSHIDNSPNSVCEAMILGMPVIATYTGGTGSLLEDRKEGILIQDGDPFSLAGAILDLFENFQLASELGNNARSRAIERHNPDTIVNDLVEVYSKVACFKKETSALEVS